MSPKPMQKLSQLLVLAVLIGVSMSRPTENIENQVLAENEANTIELEKIYNAIYRPLQYTIYDEPNTMERLSFKTAPVFRRSAYDNGGGAAFNAGNYPGPYRKRQTQRYRQCYFNPISCFRK